MYGPGYIITQLMRGVSKHDKDFTKHLISVPKNVTDFGEDLEWIKTYRDHGVLVSSEQLYELKRTDKNIGRSSYHIIKESPMPTAVAFCMPNDKLYWRYNLMWFSRKLLLIFFCFRELQMVVTRIQEAGLNIYWRHYNYDLDSVDETYGTKVLEDFSGDSQNLKLSHLISAFMILIFGTLFSSFVFILELIRGNCVNK